MLGYGRRRRKQESFNKDIPLKFLMTSFFAEPGLVFNKVAALLIPLGFEVKAEKLGLF